MTETNDDLILQMSTLLRTMGTDLGDEREVIRVLTAARFRAGDVTALMDRAIECARTASQHSEAMDHG